MAFDRYLRFRQLGQVLGSSAGYTVQREGVLATYTDEEHATTFAKAFHPRDGDLLEIEYPASYGYVYFGLKEGVGIVPTGEMQYTRKTA